MVKKIAEMAGGRRLDTLQPLRITVLAGGPGRERPVSQVSGKAVAAALEAAGFVVTLADISPTDLSALDIAADVIFPVLHGRFGEDGDLQAILEKRGLTYCGSGPEACRTAMNKHLSKATVVELQIPTPAYAVMASLDDLEKTRACWSIPVVVKPVEEGSSFGVTIVRKAADLPRVLRETFEQFGPVMVEDFVDGRELTVGILADKALPILEIRPKHDFYDYEAKYSDVGTEYTFVDNLPKDIYENIQEMSVRAAKGIGLRDFCRVDWRLDRLNRPFFLEVNAIPGFTDHSLLPKAAAAAGFDMTRCCKLIVEMAQARSRARSIT